MQMTMTIRRTSYWQPLQSNTGYARGTYNHIRNLKPSQMVHYRVFSWHTNNYGIPAVVMGSTKLRSRRTRFAGCGPRPTGRRRSSSTGTAVPAANNGGSPITHYVIQVHEDDTGQPASTSLGWTKCRNQHEHHLHFQRNRLEYDT